MESTSTFMPARLLLIFNPISGIPDNSPVELMQIITEMQARGLYPEVYLVQPDSDLGPVIQDALRRHIRMFVASGGDGTVNSVAAALAGTHATLGIIPRGTQNNVALSLGIPADIPTAVALIQNGRRIKVDMGLVNLSGTQRYFLEACSVGLFSALFPAADDIQHGRLAAIGDFLATLFAAPPADMRLVFGHNEAVETQGHVVVVGNMPFVGPHYPIGASNSFHDGLLDVLLFANLNKLQLIGTAVQMASGAPEDPRIRRFQVRRLEILTSPPMPVLVDGFLLGEGPLVISVQRRALAIIAAEPQSDESSRMDNGLTEKPYGEPGDQRPTAGQPQAKNLHAENEPPNQLPGGPLR